MAKISKFLLTISLGAVLCACGADNTSLTPENLSDQNWKNGIWVLKNGRNGFFVEGTPDKIKVTVGTKLVFAKSGERVVTQVEVASPYINIFVDKSLDPVGDGWPNRVTIAQ